MKKDKGKKEMFEVSKKSKEGILQVISNILCEAHYSYPGSFTQSSAEELDFWFDKYVKKYKYMEARINECIDRGFIVVAEGSDPDLYITDKHAEA